MIFSNIMRDRARSLIMDDMCHSLGASSMRLLKHHRASSDALQMNGMQGKLLELPIPL